MRFIDAEADCTIDRLFDGLAAELAKSRSVRVTNTAWLSRVDLRQRLEALLKRFEAGGGRVTRR
jgi:hypothetical protein